MEKKINKNKQSAVTSKKFYVHVVEIMKMDDEELYVPNDVLEEASAASYPLFPKNERK
jgi:uncharacterized circularly permuted ATP-grasp superfamily protein